MDPNFCAKKQLTRTLNNLLFAIIDAFYRTLPVLAFSVSDRISLGFRTLGEAEFSREFASYFDKKPPSDEELRKQKAKIIQKVGSFDFEKVVKRYEKLIAK